MKTIIAGSRLLTDPIHLHDALQLCQWTITEVVSGGAPGVDTLGEHYAAANRIPVKLFPANWHKYGRSAGPRRNQQMAEYSQALLAVWDGKSSGTKDMIRRATQLNLTVYVHKITDKLDRTSLISEFDF